MTEAQSPRQRLTRELNLFIVLQILTVPLVVLIFRTIEPRPLAASLAGLWFCGLSSFLVIRSFRRSSGHLRALFAVSAFFALGIAYPMLVVRAWNWAVPFDQVWIWGVPGPVVHRLSNGIFLLLFGLTVWSRWRLRMKTTEPETRKVSP